MVTIEYTGGAPVWRCRAFGGITVHHGERIDVSNTAGEALVDQHDFRSAEGDNTSSLGEASSQTITGNAVSSDAEDDREPAADSGTEPDGETPAEGEDDLAVLDNSVGELRDELTSGEYDDQLDELEQAEEERNGRQTALDAIDQRRNAIGE